MPFPVSVVMLSTSMTIDMKAYCGPRRPLPSRLPDEKERYIHAIFSSIRQRDLGFDKFVFYEAVLVPSVWFLSLDSDCQIFKTRPSRRSSRSVLKDNSIQDFEFCLGRNVYTAPSIAFNTEKAA